MDIVRFKGGLGNQMFQYALVEALRSRGRAVKCSLGYYREHKDAMPFVLNKVFGNVECDELSDEDFHNINEKWKNIKNDNVSMEYLKKHPKDRFFWVEDNAFVYYPEIFETKACVYVGYWQTEKYFRDIKTVMREKFKFNVRESKLEEIGNLLAENYVGIHIRRGDYLNSPVHDICTIKYYHNAISKMKQALPTAKFCFFSDDINWVSCNFRLNDMLICSSGMFKQYEDWYDMYLMTKCKGNIIANSSFSWWGAWLNENEDNLVIAPNIWYKNIPTPDVFCENWVKEEV